MVCFHLPSANHVPRSLWDLLDGNVQELEGGGEGLAMVQNSGYRKLVDESGFLESSF